MSKTATNALTGLRVADGKLVVTENALMPEWRDSNDPRRGITLDDLLRMTSGLRFDDSALVAAFRLWQRGGHIR